MTETNYSGKRWLYLIVGTVLLIFCGLIYGWSLFKAPFAAIYTDWSLGQLSLTFTISMLALIGLYFVTKEPVSYLVAIAVILAVYFLEILIDNTCARVKWGNMLRISWVVTLATCGVNLLILDVMR